MTRRVCSVAVVVLTASCASVRQQQSPALFGSYQFSDAIAGLGVVSGRFDVNASGRVTSFSGTCSPTPSPSPGATSVSCRVQRLSIAGHDDSGVRIVSVLVLVSETTPSPSNRTASDIRSRRFRGSLSATRLRG
jgi:hypothetical protein